MAVRNFHQEIKQKVLICDGAMGTMLQDAVEVGKCPEMLNLTKPHVVRKVHEKYVEAGADIILTNTFGGNRLKLKEYGLGHEVSRINQAAVRIAREACGDKSFLAGDIGPTGQLIEPLGDLSFDTAYEVFHEQAEVLVKAGVDLIIIETMADLQELRAAVIAARDAGQGIPVIAQMTFTEGVRSMTGTDPETAVTVLQALKVDAGGANCGKGPEEMINIVKQMATLSTLPLIVQPNAGLPRLVDGKTQFNLGPEKMAAYALDLVKAGANIIGGCCGTTPQHIRAIASRVKGLKPVQRKPRVFGGLTARTHTITFKENDPTHVMGERINPTGRPDLQQALKSRNFSVINTEARNQVKQGADILDINVGITGIDEGELMRDAVLSVQQAVDVPLSIDTKNPGALEEGLKNFAGKALINSVEGREESLRTVLPLAKRYGAAVIGLTIGERGIPEKAEERVEVARYIVDTALSYGIPREDIFIDCLTLSAGAQQRLVGETLKALTMIKKGLGVKTVLGISNVSHGLPEREDLNAAFLSMALAAGLDLPILNPHSRKVMNVLRACDVLLCRDSNARRYIEETRATPINPKPREDVEQDARKQVYQAVLNGDRDNILELVKKLDNRESPFKIINKIIIPALEAVGDMYEKGTYFLPQLMLAAETAKKALTYLKGKMPEEASHHRGSVVMATVKGDIHDIGKNIVTAILSQHGFNVIDLGKDVDAETIVRRALQEKPCIVGLSALMTTTMPQMKKTVKMLKEADRDIPVIVGGAVVTREFARDIGAFYAKDAVEAVSITKELFEHMRREEGRGIKCILLEKD